MCRPAALFALLFSLLGCWDQRPGDEPDPPERPNPSQTDWVRLEAGCFDMGKDGVARAEPVHEVCLEGFEIGRTEVTVAQYMRCVDDEVCTAPHWDDLGCNFRNADNLNGTGILRDSMRQPDRPVVCVTWLEAGVYAQWAEAQLPSEAQWEYAARSGGLDQDQPWGDGASDCDHAVIAPDDLGLACGEEEPQPACSRPQGNSEQGVCDLVGNVYEWLIDTRHETYEGAPIDGSAWVGEERTHRVHRGGHWRRGPERASATYRNWALAGTVGSNEEGISLRSGDHIGIRLVRSLTPSD